MEFGDLEYQLRSTLECMMIDYDDDDEEAASDTERPTSRRAYLLEAKAMASTPADVKEYPNSYVFIIDMPGVKGGEIKAQVEDGVLVVRGRRRRATEEDKEGGGKYLKMERKGGKFLRKFRLHEDANPDEISAVYRNGVLTVTVHKRPPQEPKKAKTIEINVA